MAEHRFLESTKRSSTTLLTCSTYNNIEQKKRELFKWSNTSVFP